MRWLRIVVVCLASACAVGCERERRTFESPGSDAPSPRRIPMTDLHAGAAAPAPRAGGSIGENAYQISEGKRLYSAFNCVGCHGHGGGGMGPPLMDDRWIYGSRPELIFNTIVEGRPNGMPSWKNRITDEQIWQLVAYVRSMSGQASIDALSGRDDHLTAGTAENLRPAETPVQTGTP
jgi:cytochrome c oxidase cbb3-type subunit 3